MIDHYRHDRSVLLGSIMESPLVFGGRFSLVLFGQLSIPAEVVAGEGADRRVDEGEGVEGKSFRANGIWPGEQSGGEFGGVVAKVD